MKVDDEHWLEGVKRIPILGGAVMNIRRFAVMHFTAGATGLSSINYWKALSNGICAHIVIERDGTIYQCRPFNRTCGHAGKSAWRDPNTGQFFRNLNSCSIGIELANAGDNPALATRYTSLPLVSGKHKNGGNVRKWEQFPKVQLDAAEAVTRAIVQRYNLDDVVGHEDISPDRKCDPGFAFPMVEFRRKLGFTEPLGKL